MNIHCAACGAKGSLAAAIGGEIGKKTAHLWGKLDAVLYEALIRYLGLWRPLKSSLAWDRAYRLSNEVLGLADDATLTVALITTFDAIDAKNKANGREPLKSHNYLKQVVKNTHVSPVGYMPKQPQVVVPVSQSKAAAGVAGFLED